MLCRVMSQVQKHRVPPRDAPMISGHAQFTTTMQIYTHVDGPARHEALTDFNDCSLPGLTDPLCQTRQSGLALGGMSVA
jgi:hypothetical protein